MTYILADKNGYLCEFGTNLGLAEKEHLAPHNAGMNELFSLGKTEKVSDVADWFTQNWDDSDEAIRIGKAEAPIILSDGTLDVEVS